MGKKSPSAPPPPDPYQAANAQSQADRAAVRESTAVNRYNVVGPWGSVKWEGGRGFAPPGTYTGGGNGGGGNGGTTPDPNVPRIPDESRGVDYNPGNYDPNYFNGGSPGGNGGHGNGGNGGNDPNIGIMHQPPATSSRDGSAGIDRAAVMPQTGGGSPQQQGQFFGSAVMPQTGGASPQQKGQLSAPTVMPQTSADQPVTSGEQPYPNITDGAGNMTEWDYRRENQNNPNYNPYLDPNSDHFINAGDPLHNMTQVITLNDQQQRIYDQQNNISERLGNHVGGLMDQLPQGALNFDGLTQTRSGLDTSILPRVRGAEWQTGLNDVGQMQNMRSPGQLRNGVSPAAINAGSNSFWGDVDRSKVQQPGQFFGQNTTINTGDASGERAFNTLQNNAGGIDTQQQAAGQYGAVQGAGAGIDARQQAAGQYGAVQGAGAGIQQGINAAGVGNTSVQGAGAINRATPSGAPQLQDQLNTSNLPGLNTDFSAERDRVEKATFDRANSLMTPQFEQQRDDLIADLRNRGLPLNGEQAMDELNRLDRMQGEQRDRLSQSAIQAGGAEHSRLFGMSSAARGQMFNEASTGGTFANTAALQQFGAGLDSSAFGNQAQEQAFRQGLDNARLGNSEQQAAFERQLASGQFGNQAQAQFFGQKLAAQNQSNEAQQSGFQNRMASQQAGNQAQAQRFGQQLAAQGQSNDAQQSSFQNRLASQQAGNQALGQQFGQNLQASQYGNQTTGQNNQTNLDYMRQNDARRQAAFDQRYQNTDQRERAMQDRFGMDLQGREYGINAAQAAQGLNQDAMGFNNQWNQQGFQNRMDQAGLFNDANSRQFAQEMAATQMNNQTQNQRFSQDLQRANFGNQARMGQMGADQASREAIMAEYLTDAQLRSADRSRGMQERMTLRANPFNEASAIIQGAPSMQMPSPMQAPAVNMQGPNISGMIYQSNAIAQQQAQQQAAAHNAGMSAFGNMAGSLGSAMIMSDPATKYDVGAPTRILDAVKRLKIMSWRYKPEHGMGDQLRMGPMADDWADKFGGDGHTIDGPTAIGVCLQSIQDVSAEVDKLAQSIHQVFAEIGALRRDAVMKEARSV